MGIISNMLNAGKEDRTQTEQNQEEEKEVSVEQTGTFKERMRGLKEKSPIAQEDQRTPEQGIELKDSCIQNEAPQAKIFKPNSYENVKEIGDAIKEKKSVIVNLTKVESGVAQRILDFISGVCHGRDCVIDKIESKIFLIDPLNKIKK